MEEWRTVSGWPDYEVSNLGRVRSRRPISGRGPRTEWRQLSLYTQRGYPFVALTPGAKRRFVHRLVLEAFVGPCPDGMEACHNNGVRTDNRVKNLRWDTRLANHADQTKHGTRIRGERSGRSRLRNADVEQILANRGFIPTRSLADAFGVNISTMQRIWNGITWRHVA